MMTNPIITTGELSNVVTFKANYPGHIDLHIVAEYRHNNDFIVLTSQAAELLANQLATAIDEAREMAKQMPLFKEAE
jgi:hypothetical protein